MSEKKIIQFPAAGGFDNHGEPPHDGGMEARIAAIESRLNATLPTLATREDVAILRADFHKEMNAQTWRLVTLMTSICTALAAATYFIAKHVG